MAFDEKIHFWGGGDSEEDGVDVEPQDAGDMDIPTPPPAPDNED